MADSFKPTLQPAETAPVLNVPDVVKLEQTVADNGTSLAMLMWRAGGSVARFIARHWPAPCRVAIVCGTGNNGGDGWVVGNLLANAGYTVSLITPRAISGIKAQPARDTALRTCDATSDLDFEVLIHPDVHTLSDSLQRADVVVDAILGTGFNGDSLRGSSEVYVNAIAEIARERGGNEHPAIVAVDAPSGLSAQTGLSTIPCVTADYTITMMVAKPGLLTDNGRAHCGETLVASIVDAERFLPRD